MRLSDRGAGFIARHEGFVGHAYRDPVGVLTIGYGFTMASRVFADYWRRRHGRALAAGDRIDKTEAQGLLGRMVEEEYGAAVRAAFPDLPQHRHDACCSVVYNLGPRALGWRWARALKAGEVAQAAGILATNYATAGGKRLPGLVRRRREEARLLEHGDYGAGGELSVGTRKAPLPPPKPQERAARRSGGVAGALLAAVAAAATVLHDRLQGLLLPGLLLLSVLAAGLFAVRFRQAARQAVVRLFRRIFPRRP
ncbi:lysozyme [Stappia sp. ICDLI1TA098]